MLHPGLLDPASVAVGVGTVVLILVLERTRVGPLGLVAAIAATSAAAAVLGWTSVVVLGDISDVPRSLPLPEAPVLALVPELIVPAVSLAFIGLVQGAGVSAAFPNPDGRYPDPVAGLRRPGRGQRGGRCVPGHAGRRVRCRPRRSTSRRGPGRASRW